MTEKTVLHIGPGKATIDQMSPGFRDGSWREIRYDIDPSGKPDILGSITDMSVIDSESVDAIYSSHNIEHVYAHEVATVFRECKRVLKPNGFLAMTCPDIEMVAKHIVATGLTEPIYQSGMGPIRPIDILYGHTLAIAGGATYMAHRTALSKDLLYQHAQAAGFEAILCRQRPTFVDLWLIATVSPVPESEIRLMMDNYGGRHPKADEAGIPVPA
jgi:SAM-dependent methyltransferase